MAKIKPFRFLSVLIVVILILSACALNIPTVVVEQKALTPVLPTIAIEPSATIIPLLTNTPQPTPTITLTPPVILNPKEAKATVQAMLQSSMDCAVPCFWGIVPGKTTFGDAKNIFTHLGISLKYMGALSNGDDSYALIYDLDSGLHITSSLEIKNELVTHMSVSINPEKQQRNVPRQWTVYSPDVLIRQYGPPSKVDVYLGPDSNPSYSFYMYFDTVNLNVLYDSYELGPKFRVCPISEQIDFIDASLGQDIYFPLYTFVPLEEATSMTVDEFSKLMTGNPDRACFNLKAEAFR